MLIYNCITIAANIIAAIVFYQSINITWLSALPLFLIALMIFQALIFKNEKAEHGSLTTAYGSNLTPNEENEMLSRGSDFLFATIPWMIPFVIFFPSPVKMLSILVYVIGLVGGSVLYKLKNRSAIIARMNAEKEERREQEKKEELGKWK